MKKKRTNYILTVKQHSELKRIAREKQVSVSELLRRIIDEWLAKNDNKNL